MPTNIFSAPEGLTGYLGNKATGRNPALLADTVIPTVSLERFYSHGQLVRELTQTSVIGAVGLGGTVMAVPSGKIWQPIQQIVEVTGIGAGDTCSARPVLCRGGGTVLTGVPLTGPISTMSGATLAAGLSGIDWTIANPLFGPPVEFGYYVTLLGLAVGPINLTHRLLYLEFDG